MPITDAHKAIAAIVGEMALAAVRREVTNVILLRWIKTLRATADGLEARLKE